jgi:hypothetical protein
MADQTPNKQKENIQEEVSVSGKAAIFIATAVANLVVAAILITMYGLTQRLEANPFAFFSIVSTAFFVILGLLIYLKKEKLADTVFNVGPIVIAIITIAAISNSTAVYNKIIENNLDKFLELAAKYEQCIYENIL